MRSKTTSTARLDRRRGALSGQARTVLVLVFLFAAAFVAVIGMKIYQERRDAVYEAELRQARAAAFLAERISGSLAEIDGAARATAAAIVIGSTAESGSSPVSILESLAERDEIFEAALLREDGRVRATTEIDAGRTMSAALAARDGWDLWLAEEASEGAVPPLLIAVDLVIAGEPHVLVASLNMQSLVPRVSEGQLLSVTDHDGRSLATSAEHRFVRPNADVGRALGADSIFARELVADRGGALAAGASDDGAARVLGVAPVSQSPLAIYVAGPLQIDQGGWRRTLVFYILLLAAPILVTVGLCAVLLMQMENIRQARQLLQDSEKRLNLSIESARCGVWDWDVANDSVFVTSSLAQMLGRKDHGNLTSTEFLSLVRREDQERVKLAIRGALGAGEVDVEFRATGLPVWLHARGKPWIGADGQPSGRIMGVAIDITEQKGAQNRVAAAETRMRQALESMGESFALWDPRRRLVLSNQKFREFFHLDEKLVKPGHAYEMLELAAQGAIKAVYDGPEPDASELELSDGRWLHLSERETQDGGLVSIGTDITALKSQERKLIDNDKTLRQTVAEKERAHQRLEELARRLAQENLRAEAANRSKSEFLRSMSHELRTPLNAINGFSEIMVQQMFGPLGDKHYVEYVQDIHDSGKHLLDLINDILDMSKIEAGKFHLALERVYPDEVAEQCARLMRESATRAGLELVVTLNDLPQIDADPRALKQILINLLSNAVKFTLEGGRVELRASAENGSVRFEVEDNGIGIGPEDLSRIGQPFVQIGDLDTKSHEGSGLGLALTKSLAELHGGQFLIESEKGRGTTATIIIPTTQTKAVEASESQDGSRQESDEDGEESRSEDIDEDSEAANDPSPALT